MKYISTRGIDKEEISSAMAIKRGLANDGGLYMPKSIPTLDGDALEMLLDLGYEKRCAKILGMFLSDYTEDELLEDAKAAYSKEKFTDGPAKTVYFDTTFMLELWHGPTCAFKDMALQIMPRLFTRALKKCEENRCAMILVATSGDTGKAALEGYKDVKNTKIKVFYPTDGVSCVQKMQMQSQTGGNVSIVGIRGNFDDAQNGVKEIFKDNTIKNELNESGVFLSSANSINWGRLVPQIVYYVSAYLDMVNMKKIALGDKIDVCVPTGNFGNIFAAYIAKQMGLPINKLICASNKNDVLTEFLTSGRYSRNRKFYTTISPSMDILISSNLERLIYLIAGKDATRGYMECLAKDGEYTVDGVILEKIKESFVAYSADEEKTKETIKEFYEKENCPIDPHTAVAVYATKCYKAASGSNIPTLTVSTASPYKFAKDVLNAIGNTDECTEVEALYRLSDITKTNIPYPLFGIEKREIIHKDIIEVSEMPASCSEFANA